MLASLIDHPEARRRSTPIKVATGGAPPAPALLERLERLDIEVTHLYGLTETYGPAVICDWRAEWDELPAEQRARRKAQQGVANLASRAVRLVDTDGAEVPADGRSEGEVVLRGNVVMLGYYKDPEATAAASVEGPGGRRFRTGDIGVLHPDGYLELRDRLKDVIISGGENIASIEVEQALASHDAVAECAVVAGPDDRWGEAPIAFVVLRSGHQVEEHELIDHARLRLARFKAPKRIVFGELPKTSTGKIQKFLLRDQLRAEEIRHSVGATLSGSDHPSSDIVASTMSAGVTCPAAMISRPEVDSALVRAVSLEQLTDRLGFGDRQEGIAVRCRGEGIRRRIAQDDERKVTESSDCGDLFAALGSRSRRAGRERLVQPFECVGGQQRSNTFEVVGAHAVHQHQADHGARWQRTSARRGRRPIRRPRRTGRVRRSRRGSRQGRPRRSAAGPASSASAGSAMPTGS